MRRVQSAVAETVIGAGESDHAAAAGRQQGGFQRGFDRFESGIVENGPAFDVSFGPTLKGDLAQTLDQLGLERMRMDVAHRVQELAASVVGRREPHAGSRGRRWRHRMRR